MLRGVRTARGPVAHLLLRLVHPGRGHPRVPVYLGRLLCLACTCDAPGRFPPVLARAPSGAAKMAEPHAGPAPACPVNPCSRCAGRYSTTPHGRIFQTARGGILQDPRYNEVWTEARKQALTPAQQRSPLGRRPYGLRHAAVSCGLNSGRPRPGAPAGPGTASPSAQDLRPPHRRAGRRRRAAHHRCPRRRRCHARPWR
jgi:hypothetical protein